MNTSEDLLIDEILAGDGEAWEKLIARYEGRLLAFAARRVGDATAEDVVQEAFIGLLRSLPNFNRRGDLESYLFAICAHKIADALRKQGRASEAARAADLGLELQDVPGGSRTASSIARSNERHVLESERLAGALAELVGTWAAKESFARLKVMELIFAKGRSGRECAKALGLKPQAVASIKHQILSKLTAKLSGAST